MRVMTDPMRCPSDAEQLAADYPHADIHRVLLPDGSHGAWVAELTIQLRAATPAALRALLAQVDQLCQSAPDADG